MAERVDVFFYGLFMDVDTLHAKGIRPAHVRHAYVSEMGLQMGSRATLIAKPGVRTHGLVMNMTHADLARLYRDPSVSMYRAEPVTVYLVDGGSVVALCYNLPVAQQAHPNYAYAARLRTLAKKLGLPEDYIDNIG